MKEKEKGVRERKKFIRFFDKRVKTLDKYARGGGKINTNFGRKGERAAPWSPKRKTKNLLKKRERSKKP